MLCNLTLDIFGGSHDAQIGVRMGGLPAGEAVDTDALQRFLDRRAPGGAAYTTQRCEADRPIFRSGLTGGKLDGTLLEAVICNSDVRSEDYATVTDIPRPSHADYAAVCKYGPHVDLRGGGRFSGRLTAPLCVAGGIALQLLCHRGIRIGAHLAAVGGITDGAFDAVHVCAQTFDTVRMHDFPVLDAAAGVQMQAELAAARADGDSVGGVIECAAVGLPAGLGEHMFLGMENRIAALAFGIPGLKGIEFGAGFALAQMRGSAANDPFRTDGARVFTTTNNSGGILGGMTSGMPLIFRCVMKPTPSIGQEQNSVSLSRMENVTLTVRGRHDPCIAVRAVPAVEAVAAIALLDALLDPAV